MTKYFKVAGKVNTSETLKLARKTAEEQKIDTVIIASIRGNSVPAIIDVFKDSRINVFISGCDGCNACPVFSEEMKKMLTDAGFKLIFSPEGEIPYPEEAQLSYRRICEGLKVCVQLAMAAVEHNIVPSGTEIICIAGTGWKGYSAGGGLDTAVIIQAADHTEFFSYQSLPDHKLKGRKIKEFICLPR